MVAKGATSNILNCNGFKTFWINWEHTSGQLLLTVLTDLESDPFLTVNEASDFPLSFVSLASVDPDTTWIFPQDTGMEQHCAFLPHLLASSKMVLV